MQFHLQNCEYLLGLHYQSVIDEIRCHLQDNPDLEDDSKSGKCIDMMMCDGHVFSAKVTIDQGSSRLRIFSTKSKKAVITLSDINFRVDIPLKLLSNELHDAKNKYLVIK